MEELVVSPRSGIIAASDGKRITAYQLMSWKPLWSRHRLETLVGVDAKSGNFLVLANGTLDLVDAHTGEVVGDLKISPNRLVAFAATGDGNSACWIEQSDSASLMFADRDREGNYTSPRPLSDVTVDGDLRISPSGDHVGYQSAAGFQVWRTKDAHEVELGRSNVDQFRFATLGEDESHACLVVNDSQVACYALPNGQMQWQHHLIRPRLLSAGPAGVVVADEASAMLLEVETSETIKQVDLPFSTAQCAAYEPNDKTLIIGSKHGDISFFRFPQDDEIIEIGAVASDGFSQFSPDGRFTALVNPSSPLILQRTRDREILHRINGPRDVQRIVIRFRKSTYGLGHES